jgi:GntR family transcriptional regulator
VLSIDQSSTTSVREQLIEQLRYLIASGHFQVNETLPSTRKLADRVGISFHTVRKAYQALQTEGLVDAKAGRGYIVLDRAPLEKSERMERGAEVVHETLQALIGLGLDDAEIEYLFHEQSNLLEHAQLDRKLLVAHAVPELGRQYAEDIGHVLQRSVNAVPFHRVRNHQDADFVFTPFDRLHEMLEAVPRADAMGFVAHLPARVLERIARLRTDETISLLTHESTTIQPLTQHIRTHSGFSGPMMAAAVNEGTDHLSSFLDQSDLVLYTPASRRRVRPLLSDGFAHASIRMLVSPDSLEAIQNAVPV